MSTEPQEPPDDGSTLGLGNPPLYWEGWIAAALLMVLTVVIVLQIVGRLGVLPGQVWTEELTRWLWVWAALIGCAATQAHHQHLRMDVLNNHLSPAARRVSEILQQLLGLAVVCYLAWQGWRGVLRTWHNESVTLPVTDAVLYAALPLAMLPWAVRLLQQLFTKPSNP
jgi:TRAP-type C4-dicarboxylate transport system permease small subunit